MRDKEWPSPVPLELVDGGADGSTEKIACVPSEKDLYIGQLREVAQGIFLDFKKTLGEGKPLNASLIGVYRHLIHDVLEHLERLEEEGGGPDSEAEGVTLEGLRRTYAQILESERKEV